VSGCNITGAIPQPWSDVVSFQRMELGNTKLSCKGTERYPGACPLPPFIQPSNVSSIAGPIGSGYSCPSLIFLPNPTAVLSLSPSYYEYALCQCESEYFGWNGVCKRCPTGCRCKGGTVTGCFPAKLYAASQQMREGETAMLSSSLSTVHTTASIASSPTSFTALPTLDPSTSASLASSLLLPCPLTITGQTLCNSQGRPWPMHGSDSMDAANGGMTAASSSASSASYLSLTGWCLDGHSDRLCSRCNEGWYSSGRWCRPCMGSGWHALIIAANVALIILLIYYLYRRVPNKKNAAESLQLYLDAASISTSQLTSHTQPHTHTQSHSHAGAYPPIARDDVKREHVG